tara:strand:+ start:265 stop:1614 length:1350 start_codon:yes stop_codon:yes gene_type:complete
MSKYPNLLIKFNLLTKFVLILIASNLAADEYYRAMVDAKPSKIPSRVALNWSDDPTVSVSVTWRTSTEIEAAYAEIAVADASANFTTWRTQVTAKTEKWSQNTYSAHFHSVTFSDLKPDTLYAYRVGSGKIWSAWYQFRTAKTNSNSFSFIYFGDAQNNLLSLWSRVIRASILDVPKANFLLHAGDLVNRANNDSDWEEWFQAGSWIHAQLPIIATPGNHEYRTDSTGKRNLSTLWRPHFTLPQNGPEGLEETVYFVDYQGARIISLNSNQDLVKQANWLDNVLTKNPNNWSFLTFHHPVYSASKGRDNKDLRELWKPIIDKHQVDLVLTGHDHSYGRGNNIGNGVNVRDEKNGTVYVVSVSGPKQYQLREDRWMTRAAENTQLYQVINVNGDVLNYRAMTATGEIYDEFDLIKQKGLPNKLVEKVTIDGMERRSTTTLDKKEKDTKVY